MPTPPHSRLLPIVFGQAIAQTDRSLLAMQERMATRKGWVAQYDAIGAASEFIVHAASVNINGLVVTAISHSPIVTQVVSPVSSSIFLVADGAAIDSVVNDQPFHCEKGRHIGFAPPGERRGHGGFRSLVVIDVQPERIEAALAALLGQRPNWRSGTDYATPQVLPARRGALAFDTLILNLCAALDPLCSHPQALNQTRIDEVFYRAFAMLLRPDLVLPDANAASELGPGGLSPDTPPGIHRACQHMLTNLDHPLTLADLERISGLSRRSLQYGFLKAHALTPMQWLREQRLLAVQQRLLSAGVGDTVTALAGRYRFNSPSQFATLYRQRFGESPSQTLGRSVRR